jgi:hypothetical protein
MSTIEQALTFSPRTPLSVERPKYWSDLANIEYVVRVTLRSPYVHAKQVVNNTSLFMTEKLFDPEDPQMPAIYVPCITGNSLRHAFRFALFTLTGRLLGADGAALESLAEPALHYLLAGGNMGKGTATLDVAGYREICRLFPWVSLFGGGLGQDILPGKLDASFGYLCCEENVWRIAKLSSAMGDYAAQCHPANDYLERLVLTKPDPRRSALAPHLMRPEEYEAFDATRNRSAKENEESGEDDPRALAFYQAIASGARFVWTVGGSFLTPMEHSMIICGLYTMAHYHRLGAKRGSGHGVVDLDVVGATGDIKPVQEMMATVDRQEELNDRIRQEWATPYVDHVRTNAAEILDILAKVKDPAKKQGKKGNAAEESGPESEPQDAEE